MSKKYNFHDLIHIIAMLRDKKTGCAWSMEQNFDTIAPYTIEEAYELTDAIAQKNYKNIKEECGDILLQVVFHSQMAKEENLFTIEDVIQSICEKMIRRNPHVFIDHQTSESQNITQTWDEIKNTERKGKAKTLADIPQAMPALQYAQKVSDFVAKEGFEWEDLSSVIEKHNEEIEELKDAITRANDHDIEEELGDVFLTLVNLARKLDKDSEQTTRKSVHKFIKRYQNMQTLLKEDGHQNQKKQTSENIPPAIYEKYWNMAKKNEK